MTARNTPETPESPAEDQLVASTLAYVRTSDGVVEIQAGAPVPAGAVPEHQTRLRHKGVLVTPAAFKKLQG